MKGIPGQTAASLFVLIMLTAVSLPAASQLLSAKEIVTKADEKFKAEWDKMYEAYHGRWVMTMP